MGKASTTTGALMPPVTSHLILVNLLLLEVRPYIFQLTPVQPYPTNLGICCFTAQLQV